MNDDELRREIEEALAVEPSPQFAARVQSRIAEKRRPSSLSIRWGGLAAGVALAAVVIALVLPDSSKPVIDKPAEIAVKVPEKRMETPSLPTSQQPASTLRAGRQPAPAAPEPEVLIDPREVAAFRKFVDGVREERIDLERLAELQQAAAKPAPIEAIALMPLGDLEPIVIESLTVGPRRIEGGSL